MVTSSLSVSAEYIDRGGFYRASGISGRIGSDYVIDDPLNPASSERFSDPSGGKNCIKIIGPEGIKSSNCNYKKGAKKHNIKQKKRKSGNAQ